MVTDKERMKALEVVLEENTQIYHEEEHDAIEHPTFQTCPYVSCRKATVVLQEGVVLL